MNLYVPKKYVENLSFILSMFFETHTDGGNNEEDVAIARILLVKIQGEL